MKKGLFIFILIVFLNLLSVNAKTIITTTGVDKTEAITAKNDQIYPGIYNWDKESDYFTNYYNSKDGKLTRTLFSVNDKSTLENGKVFTSLVNEKDDGNDYQISRMLTIGINKYLIFGGLMINGNYVPVINYYEDNILIWQYLYSVVGRGRFVNGVLDDGVIHCIGEYEQPDSFVTDILIAEISLTGFLNQMKLIKGNKNAKAHDIYKSKDGVYFVTETESYTLDYDGAYQYSNGVFLSKLSLNYDDLNMFCVKNFSGADYFASMFVDEKLYVYLAVKGMGPFPYNTPSGYTEGIVCLDKYAEDVSFCKVEINHNLENIFLLNDDNSYYIGGYASSKNEIIIYEYNKELMYESVKYYNIFNNEEIICSIDTVKVYNNHILIIITENIYSGNKNYYYFCINQYMKNNDFLSFTLDGDDFKNIVFYDNYIYLLTTKKTNNREVLNVYKIAIVKLHERNFTNGDKEYFSTFMTINYQEIDGENVLFEDVSTLKTHNYYYVQNDENLMCINEAIVKMLPITNIEDGIIYDVGKIITFNGIGYLNNILINSGHKITEEGFYILKQESEEGDIYIKEFAVKNLKTIVPEEILNNEKNSPSIINNNEYEEENIVLQVEDKIINLSKSDYRVYLFVISTLIFIGIGFLLPKKFLRRNKK